MTRIRRVAAIAAAGALIAGASACSTGGGAESGVTLQYWMWDDTQVPAYQQCADQFHEENPEITIEISQAAWSQYWTNLTTQIAAGSAPDVWVDQASYYPQFVENNQIVDIQPFVEEDDIDLDQYVEGMADLWKVDDARYGLPKDWDTMGLVYNKAALQAAGVDEASLSELTWNPQDGGTFGELIAKLTVDTQGRNGLDPAFDKNNVAVYGFLPEWADGSQGQNGWGNLAHSNGWTYADKNPFPTEFNYDDPKLVETIDWLAGLSGQGYAPPLDAQSTLARSEVLTSGGGALTTLGSFNLAVYKDMTDEYGFAPLPIGPEGRKSAINGLSDAIYAGTKHKEEAWEWVKYLASADCQNIVAESGVVFPAIKEASEKAAQVREEQGLNTQPFLEQQKAEDGTFIIPISQNGTEINQIVQDAIQSVALGTQDAESALSAANEQVNALLE
ncbi:multiple sugar transport system substrate-binding protein [Diaminobutyricimonas aerilata]|uniref:Multiple sugar transport system substrate-binding protein n=1 Tax=Diaminobutyricimonas aerilata TaxID=1162967 RepID=A0A2M9CFX1_9MICO|nr:sugar ABC transporter substrate-binding protein [Diaminobutyricimonas aerilata]PJJ70836.1 multiple sugar transport system substrate-binding protein [Diaminobutyricimonas aerilata]